MMIQDEYGLEILVDSGADCPVCPYEWAKGIGLDSMKEKKLRLRSARDDLGHSGSRRVVLDLGDVKANITF